MISLRVLPTVCFWLLVIGWTATSALPVASTRDDLPQISRQECENVRHGIVVGDIGEGAIFLNDYRCESNGEPPNAVVVPQEGEPIAVEGEVCCGTTLTTDEGGLSVNPNQSTPIDLMNDTPSTPSQLGSTEAAFLDTQVTRQECIDQGGEIIGDIGNGAIFQSDYVCDSNGQAPTAVIVPAAGEPIAIEGEVCCGMTTTPKDIPQNSLGTTTVAIIASGAASALVLFFVAMYLVFKRKHRETCANKDSDSALTEVCAEANEQA